MKKAKIPETEGLMSETKRLINTLCKEMSENEAIDLQKVTKKRMD